MLISSWVYIDASFVPELIARVFVPNKIQPSHTHELGAIIQCLRFASLASKARRLRALKTLHSLAIMSKEALVSIPGPTAGSNAYYHTHSCGDGGFSAGLLHGTSRAWSEAL